MSIPLIHVDDVGSVQIQNVTVPNYHVHEPNVNHLTPPVVVNIGNPIIDMPGCVKAHQDNQYHKSGLPVDRNLVEDDPEQVMTVCDATIPSYTPMNYEPEQPDNRKRSTSSSVPPPPDTPQPDVTPPEIPPKEEETDCPAPNQPRVGDLTQDGSEKVVGHELQGTTCVVLYDSHYGSRKIPTLYKSGKCNCCYCSCGFTASAAATPLLLRVIKPIIKKATDFVKKKLGKKPYIPSRNEVQIQSISPIERVKSFKF